MTTSAEQLEQYGRFEAASQAGATITECGDLALELGDLATDISSASVGGSVAHANVIQPGSFYELCAAVLHESDIDQALAGVASPVSVAFEKMESGKVFSIAHCASIFEGAVSPFDQLAELADDPNKVSEIVTHVRGQSDLAFSSQLADRIDSLRDALAEEPDETELSPESLRSFLGFLGEERKFNYPDVSISPDGCIRAQWRAAPNRHFAAQFLPSGDVRFVVFLPNRKHPEKVIRLSGMATADELWDKADKLGATKWMLQNGR